MLSDIAELAVQMRRDSARNILEQKKLERRLSECEGRLSAQRFQHWKFETEARREVARLRVLEEHVAVAREKAESFVVHRSRSSSI
jgi:hypothetical protein